MCVTSVILGIGFAANVFCAQTNLAANWGLGINHKIYSEARNDTTPQNITHIAPLLVIKSSLAY